MCIKYSLPLLLFRGKKILILICRVCVRVCVPSHPWVLWAVTMLYDTSHGIWWLWLFHWMFQHRHNNWNTHGRHLVALMYLTLDVARSRRANEGRNTQQAACMHIIMQIRSSKWYSFKLNSFNVKHTETHTLRDTQRHAHARMQEPYTQLCAYLIYWILLFSYFLIMLPFLSYVWHAVFITSWALFTAHPPHSAFSAAFHIFSRPCEIGTFSLTRLKFAVTPNSNFLPTKRKRLGNLRSTLIAFAVQSIWQRSTFILATRI